MHDQAKIDKHIKKNKKHVNQLNTSKWRLQTLSDQLEFDAPFLIFILTRWNIEITEAKKAFDS